MVSQSGARPPSPFRLLTSNGLRYCAVPLTASSELTAIYNSNAFWAYVLSIYLVGTERWEPRKAGAVALACLGVLVNVYGDARQPRAGETPNDGVGIGGRLLGSLLALFGSVAYAVYEVWFKRFVALPEADLSAAVHNSANRRASAASLMDRTARARYGIVSDGEEDGDAFSTRKPALDDQDGGENSDVPDDDATTVVLSPMVEISQLIDGSDPNAVRPAALLAHANFITASIGVFTIALLWMAIPILHWTGIESFAAPPDASTTFLIMGIVCCGVIFNAGFMILIGVWGPITAVSCYAALIPLLGLLM